MTKISNQYSLTNILTADLTNSRLGVNNVSPTVPLDVTGDAKIGGSLIVTGNLTAQQFIVSSSVTYLTESFASGSHKFGDSSDDNHNFTGSLIVSGSANPLKVGTNLLFVSSSGFIGINNVSPTVALDVTGAGKFSSTLNAGNFLSLSAATTLVAPTSGKSLEMVYRLDGANDYAFIQAYDRTNSAMKRLDLNGAVTILGSGNVGIGTTAPSDLLELKSASANNPNLRLYCTFNSGTSDFGINWYRDYDSATNAIAGYIRYNRGGGSAGDMAFGTGTNAGVSERMRITSAGDVGIGTSSPSVFFQVTKNANASNIARIENTTSGTAAYSALQLASSGQVYLYNFSNAYTTSGKFAAGTFLIDVSNTNGININTSQGAPILFSTTDAERMRITSDGKVYIGTSSLVSPGTFNAYTNNTTPAARFVAGPSQPDGNITLLVDKYSTTNTTSQWFLGFTINNQAVASGVITANGASQAAFGSWSDGRLKENIVDLPNQLSNILALRPVEFDYIESEGGGHQTSFIAQEFEEIYPDAVGQRPDGMKTLTGWGKTEAILVKAIQELSAEIEILKQQ